MSVSFISDLHIHHPEDPTYQALLQWMERAQKNDLMILGGDIFDFFVGTKPLFAKRYHAFLEALKRAGLRGAEIVYLEGNHDFHLSRLLKDFLNVRVCQNEHTFERGGKRFFVSHGDQVNQKDYGYRILRFFLRSALGKLVIGLLPENFLDRLGSSTSDHSRKHTKRISFEGLRRMYRSFAAEKVAEGFDFVVMGHCHDLDEMSFVVGSRSGQYMNIGYPPVHESFLSWSEGDSKIQRERLPLRKL